MKQIGRRRFLGSVPGILGLTSLGFMGSCGFDQRSSTTGAHEGIVRFKGKR